MATQQLVIPQFKKGLMMTFLADLFGDRWTLLIGLLGVVPGLFAAQWDSVHVVGSALASAGSVFVVQLLRFWLRARQQRDNVEKDNADRWYQAYLDGQARQERLIGMIIELSCNADPTIRSQVFRQLHEVRNAKVPPK